MLGAMEAAPNLDNRAYFLQKLCVVMDQFHTEGRGSLLCILRGVLWSDEVHAKKAEAVHMALDAISV